jgi:hypothetical protein
MDALILLPPLVLIALGAQLALARWRTRRGLERVLRTEQERRARREAAAELAAARARTEDLEAELERIKKELARRDERDRIRDLADARIPAGAAVAVVSRGDADLLRLGGRAAWHFPQAPDGDYAGFHPESSAEAIQQLERLRRRGAGYVLFPSSAFWWLEHYDGLRRHLEEQGSLVAREDDACAIFALAAAHSSGNGGRVAARAGG